MARDEKAKRHEELVAALVKAREECESVENSLYIALKMNDGALEKISLLCSMLSSKNIHRYIKNMEAVLQRVRDGETPEDIIADLEKRVRNRKPRIE